MKKILSLAYCLKLKNIILFLNRGLIFFSNGHIRKVVSTLPNVVKIDVETEVISTLSNVVQFNVEIHDVLSMLLNVANYNVDVHNVVSTLIWRCVASRRHINLKTTLNRLWNVCWNFLHRLWKIVLFKFRKTFCEIYIFAKDVVFSNFRTYRLEICIFARKKRTGFQDN